jgi:hypothetical protein
MLYYVKLETLDYKLSCNWFDFDKVNAISFGLKKNKAKISFKIQVFEIVETYSNEDMKVFNVLKTSPQKFMLTVQKSLMWL